MTKKLPISASIAARHSITGAILAWIASFSMAPILGGYLIVLLAMPGR